MSSSFVQTLRQRWAAADSMLCVGLDPDPARIPSYLGTGPAAIDHFCRQIIAATADTACAFKPQIAYFAAQGAEEVLASLIRHIHTDYPGIPVILDAKRGDIGSTARQYGVEAFDRFGADALTLSPFMGFDSIEPYFDWAGRGLILLCRTSNPGGNDLQALPVLPEQPASQTVATGTGGASAVSQGVPPTTAGAATTVSAAITQPSALTHGTAVAAGPETVTRLYEHLASLAAGPWNRNGELGLVVGATFPDELARVRALAPTLPLLVPGVGAQGGDVDATVRAGLDASGYGLIINSSRAILYAGQGTDFATPPGRWRWRPATPSGRHGGPHGAEHKPLPCHSHSHRTAWQGYTAGHMRPSPCHSPCSRQQQRPDAVPRGRQGMADSTGDRNRGQRPPVCQGRGKDLPSAEIAI